MSQEAKKKATKTEHLAALLAEQDGVFELTAPGGDVFQVSCQRGVGMAFTRVENEDPKICECSGWRIRRQNSSSPNCAGRP